MRGNEDTTDGIPPTLGPATGHPWVGDVRVDPRVALGGILLGKYRVERVLGEGGMGLVLAVRHVELDELFALKLLLPSLGAKPAIVARFVREAQTAARLTSNHVARVHDVGRLDDGAPYLLMEYLDGQDLGAFLAARGPLPVEQAIDFILQACDGLAEAHALGLVHRDLKPANMFVTRRHTGEPLLKLLDFGVTKHPDKDPDSQDLTLQGTLIGTPRYMSPEQLRNSTTVDARADIWALGVILHELTTGQRPFSDGPLGEVILRIQTHQPMQPRELRPDLPVEFDAIVMRCLEKEPSRRYASLEPLVDALRQVRSELEPTAIVVPHIPDASAPSFEQPDGIVGSSSPFYVARPELEEPAKQALAKSGALVRIKGPRQVGKTTLMTRLLEHATNAGARTVRVDLQLADTRILGDLDKLLRWMCAIIRRALNISKAQSKAEWDDIFGPKDNCRIMFEDDFLPASGRPLVLALLSVDRLFDWPDVADEFLTLVRGLHEMSKSQPVWSRLRLLLEYSTEMYLPMDINHSPLNVGLAVTVGEWTAADISGLAHRHGLAWREREVDELMALIGGHPYLVRVALHRLAQGMPLAQMLAAAATAEGVFATHLEHLLWCLRQQPELAAAATEVLAASEPVHLDTESAFKLVSLGLVRRRGNDVEAGLEVYRRYLEQHL